MFSPLIKTKTFKSNIDQTGISLADILFGIIKKWKLTIVFTVILSIIFSIKFIYFENPQYISEAKILINKNYLKRQYKSRQTYNQYSVIIPQLERPIFSTPMGISDLINSTYFIDRLLKNKYFSVNHGEFQPLLSILSGKKSKELTKNDILFFSKYLKNGIKFNQTGKIAILKVKASEPNLARDLADSVIEEIMKLNSFFYQESSSIKQKYIEKRLMRIKNELWNSELKLVSFLKNNEQLDSPNLSHRNNQLLRNIEIQKEIFMAMFQQFELATIDAVQSENVIQVLDPPSHPTINKNIVNAIISGALLGIVFGLFLSVFYSYFRLISDEEKMKYKKIIILIKNSYKKLEYNG